MTPEDLVAVVDVLAGLLPEFSGARIVRPWALAAAAADGSIAGIDVHADSGSRGRAMDERARAMAETIRRLKPLDRGNDAFAVVAVMVLGRLADAHMSFDRAAALAGVRHPVQ